MVFRNVKVVIIPHKIATSGLKVVHISTEYGAGGDPVEGTLKLLENVPAAL